MRRGRWQTGRMAPRTPLARFPSLPSGQSVARYESYEAAQRAVERLVRAGFPPAEVSIVGSELKSVERITGRMTAAKAALAGLMSGLMLGMFIALLLLVISPAAPLATLVSVMLLGIGFSVLWSMIGYALNRRRKEFTSVMQLVASSFVILVPGGAQAARAREILGTVGVPERVPGEGGEPGAPSACAPQSRGRTYAQAQAELRLQRERLAAGSEPEPEDDPASGDGAGPGSTPPAQ